MKEGRIIKAYAGFYYVLGFNDHKLYETSLRGRFKKSDVEFYVGDKVRFSVLNEEERVGVVEELIPRTIKLERPAVANVEQVVLVFATKHPELDYKLLDRFLLLAEAYDLEVLLSLNKVDLIGLERAKDLMAHYEEIGYRVAYTNAKSKEGIDDLKQMLAGKLSVFAGPSGVGKSTLLNLLNPEADLKTGEISEKLKRGKHTTRHVELIKLDNDGLVADTPGFTALDINFISPRQLPYLFREMWDYIPNCKFNNCIHQHEPKCRVKEAVEEGDISQLRYDNYLSFLTEVQGGN
ncbi:MULTISPECIES: ribosome small subunit-dependent GTPase A [unclassified Candidatus Frackibacter]|uniref:ribosome small subunit-dependent GTPase A n=1 Tax=unclassified Candidatus Frackibacter TaxID=2648818 RepID=UPI00088CE361|nr:MULTISPECIES: ribosome small subunit-dependent GTPase A [unclassified Candidatus Frackibacter]SDC57522.1 ribosome biogenesis GTPase [Candidatus Frackibacter sp. WG11]SEM71605.1 ribosome biogenesis GTPase [Candidatus Frackibacter sp. WG12]SFL82660.1 ribosome biogenesis GTPase [Candidatus Frackibacter sp. WG13]